MTSLLSTILQAHIRAAGHTTASIKVALECRALLIVHNAQHAHDISREHPTLRVASLEQIRNAETLAGQNTPIIIDHFALQAIMGEVQTEIIRLEQANLKLTNDRFALHRALHIIAHKIKCAPRKRPMTRPETEFNECVELAKRTLKKIS